MNRVNKALSEESQDVLCYVIAKPAFDAWQKEKAEQQLDAYKSGLWWGIVIGVGLFQLAYLGGNIVGQLWR